MTVEIGTAFGGRADGLNVMAGAITAYDPGYDPDGRIARAAIDVALALSGSARTAEPA